MIPGLDTYRSAQVLVKQHSEDVPTEAAIRAGALLEKGKVRLSMSVRSFPVNIHPLGLERVKFTHGQFELERLMARKAKPKKKTRAPRKDAAALNAGVLTKGELRKLNALKKSVGDQIGEKAFAQWLRNKTESATAVPRDRNAEIISDTLGKLVQDGGLKLPRGGYLVTRGRGRVIVTRGKS